MENFTKIIACLFISFVSGGTIYVLIKYAFKDIGWWILLGIFIMVFFTFLGFFGLFHKSNNISIDDINA